MADTAAVPGQPRRDYIDALKGLGIILVVWGHFVEYYRGTSPLFNGLFECIYMFHMALFCMCSGMVAKFRPGKLVFQQVWLYFVSQSVIFCLRYIWHDEMPLGSLMLEWLVPWQHMWYLVALMAWELTVPLLHPVREKGGLPGRAAAMLAALAVGLLGGLYPWKYCFGRLFSYYPLFAAGYLFAPWYDALDRAAKRRVWLRPAALAVFAAVYLRWLLQVLRAPEPVYENVRIFADGAYAGNYTMRVRFVVYLIGTLTVLVLLVAVGDSRWLASLGRRTLPVYLIHQPVYVWLCSLHIYSNLGDNFGIWTLMAWVTLATGGCVCFAASRPVCALVNGIANVWYKGVPALVHWIQDRALKAE